MVEDDENGTFGAGLDEQVAGVGVGVEDAEPEELLGVDVYEKLGDLLSFYPGVEESLAVGDLDALSQLHDEQALRVQPLDDLGDEDVVTVGEGALEVPYSPGLAPEVKLHRERPAQVVEDRSQVDRGFEA